MNSDKAAARQYAFEMAQKTIAPGVNIRIDTGFRIVAGFPTGEVITASFGTGKNGRTVILRAQENGMHYGGEFSDWSPAHERVVEARVDSPLLVDADPDQILFPAYQDSRILLRVNLVSETDDRWQDLVRDVILVMGRDDENIHVGTVSMPYSIKDLRRLIIEEVEVKREQGGLFTGCNTAWHTPRDVEAMSEAEYFDITMTGCCQKCSVVQTSFAEAVPRVSDD